MREGGNGFECEFATAERCFAYLRQYQYELHFDEASSGALAFADPKGNYDVAAGISTAAAGLGVVLQPPVREVIVWSLEAARIMAGNHVLAQNQSLQMETV